MARGEGPRAQSRRAIRVVGLRGGALLQDRRRTGDLPPARPSRAPLPLSARLPHGARVQPRAARRRVRARRRAERPRGVLHPADGPPRLRRGGHESGGQSGPGRDPGLAVGHLPGTGCAREGRGRVRLELAARRAEHLSDRRQGRRELQQRAADQARGDGERIRGGNRVRHWGPRERGKRPERLPRPQEHPDHADGGRIAPLRHHARHNSRAGRRDGHSRSRAADSARDAVHG